MPKVICLSRKLHAGLRNPPAVRNHHSVPHDPFPTFQNAVLVLIESRFACVQAPSLVRRLPHLLDCAVTPLLNNVAYPPRLTAACRNGVHVLATPYRPPMQ